MEDFVHITINNFSHAQNYQNLKFRKNILKFSRSLWNGWDHLRKRRNPTHEKM